MTDDRVYNYQWWNDASDAARMKEFFWQQLQLENARRELRYLRHYGNKDCTHMAEEAMRKRELEQ
jgi:hypothetical protein